MCALFSGFLNRRPQLRQRTYQSVLVVFRPADNFQDSWISLHRNSSPLETMDNIVRGVLYYPCRNHLTFGERRNTHNSRSRTVVYRQCSVRQHHVTENQLATATFPSVNPPTIGPPPCSIDKPPPEPTPELECWLAVMAWRLMPRGFDER